MISFKNLFKNACQIMVFATALTACSDMLETESTRQNFDPEIDSKTDSLFYAFGLFEAMQQLGDQYVLQGEMRGDLLTTTQYSDSMLTQLATFTAGTTNRYDSAYVYYRVINNCNYYIAHRNTELYNGSTNVSMREFVAVKALRAWAYMQLARNYGKVKFFTEPLVKISQIDDNNYPEYDMANIVSALAPDLEQYSGSDDAVPPSAGYTGVSTASPNWESTVKTISIQKCFVPLDVVLGDMYLEVGDYDKAAKHFVTYLTKISESAASPFIASRVFMEQEFDTKQEKARVSSSIAWEQIFFRNSQSDIISYIPMAPNAISGPTTKLPLYFGADYYATADEQTGYTRRGCVNIAGEAPETWRYNLPLVMNIQLKPSKALLTLADSVEYHYYSVGTDNDYDSIRTVKASDMRIRNILAYMDINDVRQQWITKYDFANVILYRNSTVLLHLAEAFNRLGMYDAAFGILKDGISEVLVREPLSESSENYAPYMTAESKAKLKTTYPLLSEENAVKFPVRNACGIHCHGAGKAVSDLSLNNYKKNKSPYTLDRVVGKKMKEIAATFGTAVGATKQDTINAIEDILCDEYALELAFEGNRYYDLMRLARHKNGHSGTQYDGSPSAYGAEYGFKWLGKKLEGRGWSQATMYLPFK